jgi:hypothetical protein
MEREVMYAIAPKKKKSRKKSDGWHGGEREERRKRRTTRLDDDGDLRGKTERGRWVRVAAAGCPLTLPHVHNARAPTGCGDSYHYTAGSGPGSLNQ